MTTPVRPSEPRKHRAEPALDDGTLYNRCRHCDQAITLRIGGKRGQPSDARPIFWVHVGNSVNHRPRWQS